MNTISTDLELVDVSDLSNVSEKKCWQDCFRQGNTTYDVDQFIKMALTSINDLALEAITNAIFCSKFDSFFLLVSCEPPTSRANIVSECAEFGWATFTQKIVAAFELLLCEFDWSTRTMRAEQNRHCKVKTKLTGNLTLIDFAGKTLRNKKTK